MPFFELCSGREFVDKRILGGFLKDDEFGLGDRHAPNLEQQVAKILVTTAPSNLGAPRSSLTMSVMVLSLCYTGFGWSCRAHAQLHPFASASRLREAALSGSVMISTHFGSGEVSTS
jgi:hypothetical protein